MTGRGEFSLGGPIWPGLSKLLEECGEVVQVGGKLIGAAGVCDHWDGTNLKERMEDELADLSAAIDFFVARNGLDAERIDRRAAAKEMKFLEWDTAPTPPLERQAGTSPTCSPNSEAPADTAAGVSVPAALPDLDARGASTQPPETTDDYQRPSQ